MQRFTIRPRIAGLLFVLLSGCPAVSRAGDDAPIVGAIRWDAWYGEGGVVKQMERSLGPPKYHFRLPWFARVDADGCVHINGDAPEVMDREIAYAAQAGLNYWAFVHYWDELPEMNIALNRYLAAPDKKGMRFCFVEEGSRLDRITAGGWGRLVESFRHPDYQTVTGGRPLLYVFGKPAKTGRNGFDDLRRACSGAGLKEPYLVLMGWNPAQDVKEMTSLGLDAVSAYACGGGYVTNPPAYAKQCERIRRERWEKCRELRIPSITFASSGWDTRPRNERPPSWIKHVTATPDPTPYAQQQPLLDAVTATPAELAAHVREAVAWTRANRDINPANAIVVYAWNEHDEGGWIQPTRGADGRPDESRVKALGEVLRPAP